MIKIGIVGSRRRNTPQDKQLLRSVLTRQLKKGKHFHLVSGGCPQGADRFAEELAEELLLPISIHDPDRESLPEDPQYYHYVEMFFKRNTLIAEECDILLAMPAPDRKGGTEDTIEKTIKLKKKVVLL